MTTRTRLPEPQLAPEARLPDAVGWALAHAARAPSELNAQPWHHSVAFGNDGTSARIELGLERSRLLPQVDPDDREAVLACGAWLLNLRLALDAVGLLAVVQLYDEEERPDLLAAVAVSRGVRRTEAHRDLRQAVFARATHRAAFEPGTVPTAVLDHLVAEAAREGALVSVLGRDEQLAVARLGGLAVQEVRRDDGVQREVAAWSRPRVDSEDGVPGAAHSLTTLQAWLEPTRLCHGLSHTSRDEEATQSAERSATLLVLGSPGDDRTSLLRAGAGMQRLLLRATASGLAASYRNAALHVPALRRELGRAVQLDHPQVVLRLGLGAGTATTGRHS